MHANSEFQNLLQNCSDTFMPIRMGGLGGLTGGRLVGRASGRSGSDASNRSRRASTSGSGSKHDDGQVLGFELREGFRVDRFERSTGSGIWCHYWCQLVIENA